MKSPSQLEVLFSLQASCNIHVKRINEALMHVKELFPLDAIKLEKLNYEQICSLELLTSRFAKLHDTMGAKIFCLLSDIIAPSQRPQTFIDVLHNLEKMQILSNKELWFELREIRNGIAHEYPDSPHLLIENLNELYNHCPSLINLWEKVSSSISHLLTPRP